MSRLTERNNNNYVRFIVDGEIIRINDTAMLKVAEKLERYEDLEEQGKLIEQKHGHWILKHVGAGHYWECSVCHTNTSIYVTKDTNYCPHCGAKMDEVE